MPFKKVGDHYVSPTGRHFTAAQVRLYYAHGGKFPGAKREKHTRRKLAPPLSKRKPS